MLPRPLMIALQEGAQPATPSQSPLGGWTSMLPLLLIFAIFYFVMIRPEGKKRKEREAMLQRIKKGDRVMTTGGMYASVAAVQDDVITLQVADGVRVRFARQAIQSLVEETSAEPSPSA